MAIPRPIPCPEPVTIATLPSNLANLLLQKMETGNLVNCSLHQHHNMMRVHHDLNTYALQFCWRLNTLAWPRRYLRSDLGLPLPQVMPTSSVD
jgi:hypothetical protein